MKLISATDLRTKTLELIETLKKKQSVGLIYKSKLIAEINPTEHEEELKTSGSDFLKFMQSLNKNGRKTTPEQREKIYREELMKKHG
jgi:hypothetical protein